MIGSVLVANRGEIACRIFRTAGSLGIRTIAVATEADRSWRHWQQADEAVFIGEGPANESYMDAGRIISAAKKTGAEAIHPGYGFLSENADFARQCANAGIIFIGPPPDAIDAMGLKSRAKEIMADAGVPVVPGYHGDRQQAEFLRQKAYEIGYPVVIKAIAGGGGRGMRVVEKAMEFDDLLASAQREAAASFGNDKVLIERYLENPRHIEVQIIGDTHGNLLHLFERDCSVQRRHQKVIEEAPAPGMTTDVRRALGEAAVRAARSVDYSNAGTVEFIVDNASLSPADGFYFMEMNTRLQVEHPVTEMVTGIDLVEWQLRIASGEHLPLSQNDLSWTGHAIEARLYAEDPSTGFQPSMGRLCAADLPQSDDVRVDSGIAEGTRIGPHYDSMLAKLIVHAPDRQLAVIRLLEALAQVRIAGVKTNKAFLRAILGDRAFKAGAIETSFVDSRLPEFITDGIDLSVVGAVIDRWIEKYSAAIAGPWGSLAGFETGGLGRKTGLDLQIDGEPAKVELTWHNGQRAITVNDEPVTGGTGTADIIWADGTAYVLSDAGEFAISFPSALERVVAGDAASGEIRVPMHGRIASLRVEAGDAVTSGDVLYTLEAMKMEHTIKAPADGIVSRVQVELGEQVEEDVVAVVIRPGDQSDD